MEAPLSDKVRRGWRSSGPLGGDDSRSQEASTKSTGGLRLRAAIWVGAVTTYLTLIGLGARGLRGGDEYWYATDLVLNRAKMGFASNFIYPVVWSSPEWSPDRLPPPIHNSPVIYAAMAIDKLFSDEYLSWVVLNSVLGLVSAILVYLIAKYVTSKTAATVAAALFLLSPLTLRFTLNPLAEQANVLFALLLVWGTLKMLQRQWLGVVVMSGAVAMLAASRSNMLLLVPLGVVLCAILAIRGKRVGWPVVWTFGVLSTCTYFGISALLPPHPWENSISVLLAGSTPADVHNLGVLLPFTTSEANTTLGMLLQKLPSGLRGALIRGHGAERVMAPWVLFTMVFGLIAAPRRQNVNLIKYWAVGFVGIYLLTSALFQPHYRYLAALTPLAIILAVAGAQRVIGPARPRLLTVVAAVSAAVVLAASVLAASAHRAAAESDAEAVAAAKRLMATLPPGATLFLHPPGKLAPGPTEQPLGSIQWSYAVAPRMFVALMRIGGPTACLPTEVVKRWNVTSILAPETESRKQIRDAFCNPDEVSDMTVIVPATGESYRLQPRRSSVQ